MSDNKHTIDVPDNLIVVAFGAETKASDLARKGFCLHHQYVVDEHTRSVACGACGAALDPFDLLNEYAKKERRFHGWDERAREAQKEIEALKDEEKRVKARTRSHSRKDAATAVAEEKRKEGLRKQAIAAIAREMRQKCERIERLLQGGRVHEHWER